MAELVAVKLVFGVAWKLFAPKTASQLEHGDIAEEKLRQMLLNEFQKIHEHLNALRRKELVAAISLLETGYDLVSKDPTTAKEEFRKARDAALMAFGVVPDITDKLMATKILVLASIHEFNDNIETAKTLVLKYVSRMNALPEVVKVCQVTFDSSSNLKGKLLSLTGKASRRDVMELVANINYSAYDFITSSVPDFNENWPRVVWEKSNIHPVHDLCLLRGSDLLCTFDKEFGSLIAVSNTSSFIFMAFASNGVSEVQNNITVFQHETGSLRHLVGHTGNVLSLASNDQYLFSASYDKTIMIWDINSLECIKILNEHTGAVRTLCISEQFLFSGSTDSLICVWSLNDLSLCKKLSVGSPVAFLTCSKKKFLYCLTAFFKVQIWDVVKLMKDHIEEPTCIIPVGTTVKKLMISDNLMFACGKDTVEIVKLGSLRQEGVLNASGYEAALLPSNKYLILSGQDLDVWSTRSGKKIMSESIEQENVIIDFMWMNKSNLFVAYYDTDVHRLVLRRY